MKLESHKQVWGARLIAWIVALVISCAIIFGSSFMLGPSLFSSNAVSRKIAVTVYCPGAVETSEQQGASGPTTSSPSGTYGHTVQITCTMADGSTKIINNEEFALASIGGMFGGGALCGLGIAIPIMLVPLFLFRKKRNPEGMG
jgi:hypothetical protein